MRGTPTQESIKEGFRVIVLAIIPVSLLALEAGFFSWESLSLSVVIAALRALDKYLHENARGTPDDGLLGSKGLTGF